MALTSRDLFDSQPIWLMKLSKHAVFDNLTRRSLYQPLKGLARA